MELGNQSGRQIKSLKYRKRATFLQGNTQLGKVNMKIFVKTFFLSRV